MKEDSKRLEKEIEQVKEEKQQTNWTKRERSCTIHRQERQAHNWSRQQSRMLR